MHRLFLGCNLWSALFLTAAALLGRAGSPWHVRVSIFAAFFACLVQCGAVALFLGAAKLVKEHVGRFNMPLAIIDRLNGVYHRLIPAAAIGATLAAAASVAGGLAHVDRAPVWTHATLAVAAWLYLIAVIPIEFRLQGKLHGIITDVERLLPAPAEIPSAPTLPGYRPDQVVLDRAGRARALLYIGLTIPLPYLGYTFISGHDLSYLMLPSAILSAGCLGWAAREYRGARRGHQG